MQGLAVGGRPYRQESFVGLAIFSKDFICFRSQGETMKSVRKQLISLVRELQNQQESSELEFKKAEEKLPESFWETYSSFANTGGGYILLGVNETPWEVKGVKNPNKILSDLCNSANNKDVVSYNLIENKYLQVHSIEDKKIISVYVPEVEEARKPVYLKGNPLNAYIRKHEGDYKISEDDLKRFSRNAQQALDGELLDEYILEDLNVDSVLAFKNHLHSRNPSKNYLAMDNLEFLQQIGAYQIDRRDQRKPKMTVACLLFFGKYQAIRQKFPHFHLEYLNHRHAEGKMRWSDRVCTGDLTYQDMNVFEFFQLVWEKLRATIQDCFELDRNSERKSPAELQEALREALANMLIHADYFDWETDVKVTAEDLYYTFTNPGKMLVTESQFFMGGVTRPRNTTLIGFFRNMGISDRAGTGGATLLNFAAVNRFHAPEIRTSLASTVLKLWIAAPLESHPEFDEKEKMIYEYIFKSKDAVSVPELEKITGLTLYQIRKVLASLTERSLLTKMGRARATRYVCTPSIVERKDIVDRLRRSLLEMGN